MVEARFTLLEKENQQLRQQLTDTSSQLTSTRNELEAVKTKLNDANFADISAALTALQNATSLQARLQKLEGQFIAQP
jgi:cytochrome c553